MMCVLFLVGWCRGEVSYDVCVVFGRVVKG